MRSRLLPNLLVVLVLAVLAFGVWSFVYDMEGPEIAVEPKVDRISPNTKLAVRMKDKAGVRELSLA
ncbi:MAG: M23 family peptidase, partial [Desulfovibrio sp.]|nr:M23 family peptidase [Desulfovibrio sp.]